MSEIDAVVRTDVTEGIGATRTGDATRDCNCGGLGLVAGAGFGVSVGFGDGAAGDKGFGPVPGDMGLAASARGLSFECAATPYDSNSESNLPARELMETLTGGDCAPPTFTGVGVVGTLGVVGAVMRVHLRRQAFDCYRILAFDPR